MMRTETMLVMNILLILATGINTRSAILKVGPASNHQEQWTKNGRNIRGHFMSNYQRMRNGGATLDQRKWTKESISYIDNKDAASYSGYKEPGGSRLKVKYCPIKCACAFKEDPNFPEYTLKLVVKDCTSDPSDQLQRLFNTYSDVLSLELNNCQLSRLPQDITILQGLNVLYLIRNYFKDIPGHLQELPLLAGLFVMENKAEHIRIDNITKLEKLQVLEMSECRITALPDEIANMKSLGFLNASFNYIQAIPRGIAELTRFVEIDLGKNEIKEIPAEIGNLRNLVSLFLDYNELVIVPSTIGNLSRLQLLWLTQNRLQSLPPEISKLNDLEVLLLDGNLFREVPTVPSRRLAKLWLAQNMIKTMPCEILEVGQLQMLQLNFNDLTSFDCSNNNHHLERLDLSHNALDKLSCYYGFEYMTVLDISFNNIIALPTNCTPFAYSRYPIRLNLSFNKITTLNLQQFCSHDFRGIFEGISFQNNMISSIQTNGADLLSCFDKDAVINLANNNISTLDCWPLVLAEKKPIYLDVTGNNLTEFSNSGIMFLPTFQADNIFLFRNNQIKHFMDIFSGWEIIVNTTQNLNTLLTNIYFDLGGNPLVCDCVDYEVYRYIQTLRTELYNNLACLEPLPLKGMNPQHIPLGSFVCDVDVDCPTGCTCLNVPHSQSINVTCGSYIETDIPETLPDLPNENYRYCLDFSNQSLTQITSQSYLEKATEIRLSNNSISLINISSSHVLEHVSILHIDNNLLQRLPESLIRMTIETAVDFRIGGNPWVCDCKILVLKNWITTNTHIVKDKDQIHCYSPKGLAGEKVVDITRSMVCPGENKTAVYIVIAIAGIVLVSVMYFGIRDAFRYTNWRLIGSDECDGEGKEFDIFMCSADADYDYVENFLIPELEKRDFRVLYHREHFHGGKPITVNISEAIEKSKRTLAVFSEGFRDSNFCMHEFNEAYHLDVQNHTRRLITIRYSDLDMSKLEVAESHYFKTHTYIESDDLKFWKLLECTLPKKRLGAQRR